MLLKVRSVDVFPAVEPGIDGPGARPHHRQTRAENRQPDRNAGVARDRKSDPQFCKGYDRSGDRRPQTGQKENSGAPCDDLRRDELGCCSQMGNPMMN